jgi:transposase
MIFRALDLAIGRLKNGERQNRQPLGGVKMYPLEYRKCVVHLYHTLGSLRAVASIVQPSISTISRWAKTIQPKHSIRKSKPRTITEDMIAAMKVYLNENPTHSAYQVRQFLKDAFGIIVSRQLVQVAISKRMEYTYKRTRKRGPDLSTNLEFMARKREFIRELNHTKELGIPIVSIDESGVDERARPRYGYSPIGTPAIVHQPPVNVSPHVRTSILMAISSTGVRKHELTTSTITNETFANFVTNLPYPEGSVILMDNHSMHDTTSVKSAMLAKGYKVLFTPPYSPEFNPIEMLFGTIKNEYYKIRYDTDFRTVAYALDSLIVKHGTPYKLAKYVRHVTDMVGHLYAKAQAIEGTYEASIKHPTHKISERWKGVKKHAKNITKTKTKERRKTNMNGAKHTRRLQPKHPMKITSIFQFQSINNTFQI